MNSKIKAAIKNGQLIPFSQIMAETSPEDRAWIYERARYLQTAAAIRRLRRKLNLTQKELAEKMQVKREIIARAESGQHNVTLETLYRIADATGKSISIDFT